VHGEPRHLREHAELAGQLGIPHAVAPRNGDLIRLAPGKPEIIDEVPSGRLYIDGRILLPQGDGVIRARQRLASEGLIVVAIALDGKNRPIGSPQLLVKGLPEEDNEGTLLKPLIETAVEDAMASLPRPKLGDDRELENALRRAIRNDLFPRWGKRGDISVLIVRS
jgi:ribonuclease J